MKTILPKFGDKTYRSLRDFTNEELISCLNNNETTDLSKMTGLLSEILRRMNERQPLFPKGSNDWENPITP